MSEPEHRLCIVKNRFTSDYSRYGGQTSYKALLDGPNSLRSTLLKKTSAEDWYALPSPDDEPWVTGYANLDGGFFIDFDIKTLMFFAYGMPNEARADIIQLWQDFRTYTPRNENEYWDAVEVEMNRSIRSRGSVAPDSEHG